MSRRSPPASSRPTTSAGIYPDQIDEDVAYRVGRAFARVLRDLRGAGDAHACGSRSATTCASTPPRSREALRPRPDDEGCDVLDIGMVGTEMVYYAVGSRELDGGVSVTASHNPKQWAGFKLVREGALAAVRRPRHPGRAARGRRGGLLRARPAQGTIERADIYEEFQRYVLGFIDAEAIRPMEVVLDGGNGMAGPMIGPLHRLASRSTAERLYFEPNGEFPGHEPNPLLEENRKLIIDTVLDRRAPSSASPGTATRTAASSSTTTASSCPATS